MTQVKSKKRVADHGEVFTAEREVNAMLDLVKQETDRLGSRFLEPACGDGNFLAEILRRKLNVAKRESTPYKRKSPLPYDFEWKSVWAVCDIYGVDILIDNILTCRERLFDIWDKEYKSICNKEINEDCREAVRFILSRNIVCGNALSLKKVDGNCEDTNEPIVFSEWAFVTGANLQRSDYTFDKLLEGPEDGRDLFGDKKRKKEPEQQSLFGKPEVETPDDEGVFLKKYVSHYRRVQDNG